MRQRIFQRLAALWIAVALIAPMGFTLRSSAGSCSCGQATGCSCMMTMPHAAGGARCRMPQSGGDRCAMKSSRRPGGVVLPVVFDLRGWLQAQPCDGIEPVREPAGAVAAADVRPALFLSQTPEVPPPRPFQAVPAV